MGETLSSTAAPEAPLGHPGPGGAQLENTQSNEYPCLIEVWCQPGSSPRFAFFGFLAVSLYDFCEFLRTRFLSVISGSLICLLLVWVRPMSCFPVLSCTSFCTPSARQGIQSISKNPWDSFLWEEHLWLRAGGITRAWGLTVQQARSLKGNMWDPCSFKPFCYSLGTSLSVSFVSPSCFYPPTCLPRQSWFISNTEPFRHLLMSYDSGDSWPWACHALLVH